MFVETGKFEKSVGQASRLEIQLRVYITGLSPRAGNSARISVLQFGGKIPSSLGNFSLCC